MKIKGSVSLITGGGQGFGRAFTRELLQRGGKVAVVDIDDVTGLKTCQNFEKEFGKENIHFIHCDVTDTVKLEDAFDETVSKFGRLDILCNNAGIAIGNSKKIVEVNLTSVIHGTHLGIKYMKAANHGHGGLIVNISSIAGLQPLPVSPVYSATKFGVVGFTQSLKNTNTSDNIRVNCICPTFARTGMMQVALETRPEVMSCAEAMGIVSVDDVAKAFMELVNDDSRDGEIISVTTDGLAYVTAKHEQAPVQLKQEDHSI